MKIGSFSPKRSRAELSVCLWVGLLWCVFVLSEVHEFCAVFCVKFMSSKVTAEGSDRNVIQCCTYSKHIFSSNIKVPEHSSANIKTNPKSIKKKN